MQTIIECLKYVTTGTLPPFNDRGISFIVDPKIIGEVEAEAQVRLKFRAFNGKQVIVNRHVALKLQGKGFKFESLSQTLTTRNATG